MERVTLPTENEISLAVDRARCRMSEVSFDLQERKYVYFFLGEDEKTKMGSFATEDLADQHLHREIVPIAIQSLGGDLDRAKIWNKGRVNKLEYPSSTDDEVAEYFLTHT